MTAAGRTAFALSLLLALPGLLAAQSSDDDRAIHVSYQWHRDRFHYSFENASSIDTPFLVPHSFVQTYRADNQWLTVTGRYTLFGSIFESSAGLTPRIRSRASDIDTFFDPGNDVVTSGTDGEARLQAWRLAQTSEGRIGGIRVRLGYRYRRDRAIFLPADIVVTHSVPPAVSRRFTSDREYTTSQVQEFSVEAGHPLLVSTRWRLTGTLRVSPLILARLTTELPDKYAEAVVADARSFAVGGRIELERRSGWPLLLAAGWEKAAGYRASQSFNRDALEISAGWIWRR